MTVGELADTFSEVLESLPSDWTDLELDLRIAEDRYIDAAAWPNWWATMSRKCQSWCE